MFFITGHHMLIFAKSRIVFTDSFHAPTHGNWPVDWSTHKMLFHQKNVFSWGRSLTIQCKKAKCFHKSWSVKVVDQLKLVSTILVFCGIHHAPLSKAGQILNLLGQETFRGVPELFCICIWHFPLTLIGVNDHRTQSTSCCMEYIFPSVEIKWDGVELLCKYMHVCIEGDLTNQWKTWRELPDYIKMSAA
jgi:hypothetical protein